MTAREADHSPPSSSEVNKAWSYTSTPPYVFMAWSLVQHRDNLTVLYLHIFYFTFIYCRYKSVSSLCVLSLTLVVEVSTTN